MKRTLFGFLAALVLSACAFGQSSGFITSNQCVALPAVGLANGGYGVTGTWTGTLTAYGIVGQGAPAAVGTASANGSYTVTLSGYSLFEVCGNTVTSGAAFVQLAPGVTSVSSGGSASGIVPRASVCTGNVDTVLSTDRAGYVTWKDASACAVTLPQAGSAGFAQNFPFVGCDIGAGTATITPTVSTISFTTGAGYTSGAASLALSTGQCAFIYSDNTNYFALAVEAGSLSDLVDTPGSVLTASVPLAWSAGTAASGTNPQWFRNTAGVLCFAAQGDVADVCMSDGTGVIVGSTFGFSWAGASGNATGAIVSGLWNVSANLVGSGTGSGNPNNFSGGFIGQGGINVGLNATATITGVAVVKIDTANANQVVVTATTDTGGGIAIGICTNAPSAGNRCNIQTSGVASPILGTGTCSIGNFVIVDTTTAGRVQCTATYTAGTVLGKALAAQATVGSAVTTLVGLR